MVKPWILPGVVERYKIWVLGPIKMVRNHHQSGGGGAVVCAAGDTPPLQVCLMLSGAQQKILKNERKMGTQT